MSKIQSIFDNEFGSKKVRYEEPMFSHTTLKVGGPAECYVEVDTLDDFVKAVSLARSNHFPFFVLGTGHRLIVRDGGIRGVVIKNNCRKYEVASMKGVIRNRRLDVSYALVSCESGALVNQLVRFSIDQGLSGLEYFLGLPGTIGGEMHHRSSVMEAIYAITVLNEKGDIVVYDKDSVALYAKQRRPDDVILSSVFRLVPFDKTVLWDRGTQAVTQRNTVVPHDTQIIAVFKHITFSQAMRIPTPNHITVPWYLIEQVHMKGKRVGDAMVSVTNPNYIVNLGQASASDVLDLLQQIKDAVFKKFGVTLEVEAKIIGET